MERINNIEIRINENGTRNLADLRKALEVDEKTRIHSQGGDYIISRYSEQMRAWVEGPSEHIDERAAIEKALGLEPVYVD